MRKVLILLIVLILLLTVSCACSSENGSNGVESENPAISEEPTSFQLLSEALYFFENDAIMSEVADLSRRGVTMLSEAVVVSGPDEDGWRVLRMTTFDGEVYYRRYREIGQDDHRGRLFFAEQWELWNKHLEFFIGKSENPVFLANFFVEGMIPEIVDYEVIEDFDAGVVLPPPYLPEWQPEDQVVLFLRIEVINGEVYYLGFDASEFLQTVRKDSIDGEVLYTLGAGGWRHLMG